MGNLTITNRVLERYIKLLLRFDNKTKKKMIAQLTNSLELKNASSASTDIAALFGAWEDDRTTAEIIEEIRKSRIEPTDKENLE